MVNYAQVIKDMRACAGMTIDDMAKKLEVTSATLWRWEHGEKIPQRRKKWAIKRACENMGIYCGLSKEEWGV